MRTSSYDEFANQKKDDDQKGQTEIEFSINKKTNTGIRNLSSKSNDSCKLSKSNDSRKYY